jgi:AP2 domain/HNH endonuclease
MADRELITQEYLHSIMNYDPDTGVFTWKWREDKPNNVNAAFAGKAIGTITEKNYLQLTIDYGQYPASVIAWVYMKGIWPEGMVDHKNRNTLDNRFDNLRDSLGGQNQWNRGKPSNNTTGFKGVCYDKSRDKYTVYIQANHKRHFIGRFDTPEAAHAAYCEAAHRLHGDFARTE